MAFSMNNGGPARGRFRAKHNMSEMNVVPLVDVVLVLLIIFMVTAQVMEFGLEIEVPEVTQVETTAEELPVVSITRTGGIYLNEDGNVNINSLGASVRERFGDAPAVYVKCDRMVPYENLAQVISALDVQQLSVRLVMQPEEDTRN